MGEQNLVEGRADPTDPAPRQRRRRGQQLVRAIHEASVEELVEVGLERLTMEGIARRAGTAKTSLYRRWSTPEEIVLDAFERLYPQEAPSPGAEDLRGDLIRALRLLRNTMATPLGRAMGALVLHSTQRPELWKRLERIFDERGGRFTRTVLLHYAERGHIDPTRITPVTVDLGEALVMKYSLDQRDLPDDAYLADIVDQAILPAIGIGPGTGPEPAAR